MILLLAGRGRNGGSSRLTRVRDVPVEAGLARRVCGKVAAQRARHEGSLRGVVLAHVACIDDVAGDVSQTVIAALEAIGELQVVQTD
mgnify:CR=1 FL=1